MLVDALADLGWEAVDAEPAEVARGVEVGEQHAHDGHVRHRELAQRPAGQPGLGVVVEADREVAAAERAAGPQHLGLVAADRVEDDVGATVAGLVHHDVEDVLGGVVDRAGRAELGAQRGLLAAAGHRDHPSTGRDRELDRRRTDGAGAAADQDGLALPERGPLVQGQVGDVEGQRERRRLDVGELRRRRPPRAGQRPLGEPAERLWRDADDPVAHPLLGTRSRRRRPRRTRPSRA